VAGGPEAGVAGQAGSGGATVSGGQAVFAQVSLPALINGAVGVVIAAEGRPVSFTAFTVAGAKITAIDVTDHPSRIAEADLAFLGR